MIPKVKTEKSNETVLKQINSKNSKHQVSHNYIFREIRKEDKEYLALICHKK